MALDEQAEPLAHSLNREVTHRAGMRVDLRRDRREEAATGEDVVLDVLEEPLGEL